MGRTECQTRILIASGLWLVSKGKSNSSSNSSNESEMVLFFECMLLCAQKVLDTADIVREAMLRYLSGRKVLPFQRSGSVSQRTCLQCSSFSSDDADRTVSISPVVAASR